MFGVGWSELLLTLFVAIVVVGPQDIPKFLYNAGKILRKIRLISDEVKKSLDVVLLEGELQEITHEANKVGIDNINKEIEIQSKVESKEEASNDRK